MLNFVGQLFNVLLVKLFKLVEVLLFAEKDISLVEHQALESRQVDLARTLFQVVVQLAKSCHNNMRIGLACSREVSHSDICVLVQLRVNVGNLRCKLTEVGKNEHLRFSDAWVDTKSRADRERASLTRTVLTLSHHVVVDATDWSGDERDSQALNVRWLDETKLLSDAANQLFRDMEIVFIVPRLTLIDEYASYVFCVFVLYQFGRRTFVVSEVFVFRTNRVSLFFFLLLFHLFSGYSCSSLHL